MPPTFLVDAALRAEFLEFVVGVLDVVAAHHGLDGSASTSTVVEVFRQPLRVGFSLFSPSAGFVGSRV